MGPENDVLIAEDWLGHKLEKKKKEHAIETLEEMARCVPRIRGWGVSVILGGKEFFVGYEELLTAELRELKIKEKLGGKGE